MNSVVKIPLEDWNEKCSTGLQAQTLNALEEGKVVFLPRLRFSVLENERPLLSLPAAGKSKNVSFDVGTGKLRGTGFGETETGLLHAMMRRFANCSRDLLATLLPHYQKDLIQSRTSFRPVEIAGRSSSWRKDDTRLHVDSFPSSPVQGKRILRVFSNVDPDGGSRSWRIGEPIERVAGRYLPSLSGPVWGSSQLLRWSRITRSRRTPYDHFMLQLHDRLKADPAYQSAANQINFDFPAGSTWIVYTDQVPHAAMSGRCALEQTFFLPVASMMDQSRSPLRTLERLTARKLA